MKRIAVIDADLIGRKKHRFPNLACEKISGYWKRKGAYVELKLDYTGLDSYDQVYISKVFTDTPIPDWVRMIKSRRVHFGGTGFYFDRAKDLPKQIEHGMPDYSLYDSWIEAEVQKAETIAITKGEPFNRKSFMAQFREYTDYSIGFITRGCFRKCPFCVNQKFDHVFEHSPLEEFLDPHRKHICLLDDNFLGCPNWRVLLRQLQETGKKFKFKQGLDERLLTEEKCELLFSSKYDGDFTFAFDNIEDYDLIQEKLKLIARHRTSRSIKFYLLVGFESTDYKDIENAFRRIALLLEYGCLPYVMRYQDKDRAPWKESKYAKLYTAIARWCNQPRIIKKMSFRYFCEANQALKKDASKLCTCMQAMTDFEREHPEIAQRYFDLRYIDP